MWLLYVVCFSSRLSWCNGCWFCPPSEPRGVDYHAPHRAPGGGGRGRGEDVVQEEAAQGAPAEGAHAGAAAGHPAEVQTE